MIRSVDSYITHKDVSWLTDKTVGGCQPSKRTELYEHLDIEDQEVENIRDRLQLQGKKTLEEEVRTILDHGLIEKKRTRRYLLDKLKTFDPYLARSYMSFLAQVLLETLLEKLLTFQDVMWLTNKLVGGVCFNSVDSLYHLFDIGYQDIDRIRSHYVRKEDSFVDEVFMILDYGLRRQKKKRRYVLENLLLLDEDLAQSFKKYLLSH
ncbi:hypothetical protein HOLleu_39254 [Holothuria leucospilota]|uniref:Uncharacterized protein n=1 Tax=Holothuria leucospilota TaxID=206669 RepID=A0A9Q1BER1_HOLLE|nr:hypothetical protein HOLleu_39254 [Holothuria leucospilota]